MILIDTHVVVWLAFADHRISDKAMQAIRHARRASEPLAISDISLWEIAFAAREQRIPLETSVDPFLHEIETRFLVLPITGRVADFAVNLAPPFPKDPADRIIAATALDRGLSLLTADRAIQRSRAVPTIW